ARNFRNEGVDRSHNPEFTMMECYQAYADYQDMMRLVEELYAYIAQQATGTTAVEHQGILLDLTPPWQRVSLRNAIREHTGIDYADCNPLDAPMKPRGYEVDPKLARGRLIDDLQGVVLKGPQASIKGPVFIYDYPADLLPLAKRKPGNPGVVEGFQPYAGGLE